MNRSNSIVGPPRRMHTTYRSTEGTLENIVYLIFGIIEAILALRFLLRALGANATANFVALIYRAADFLRAPFTNVVSSSTVSGMTLEWNTLIAIVVYALIAWAIVALLRALFRTRGVEADDIDYDDQSNTPITR